MDNRQNILNESLSLFSEKGYHAVGIKEIVDRSKISKPTLYHYFGNKEGLFQILLEEEFLSILEFLKRETFSCGEIYQKMLTIVDFFLKDCFKRVEFYQIYLSLSFSPPQSEETRMGGLHTDKIYSLIEDMFISAVSDHGNMQGRHRNYSASFLGLINTYISLLLKERVQYSEALVQSVVHQFSHGIYS